MEPEDRLRLDDILRDYNVTLERARQRAVNARKAAAGMEAPDMEPLKRTLDEAKKTVEAGDRQRGSLLERARYLDRLIRKLEKASPTNPL